MSVGCGEPSVYEDDGPVAVSGEDPAAGLVGESGQADLDVRHARGGLPWGHRDTSANLPGGCDEFSGVIPVRPKNLSVGWVQAAIPGIASVAGASV